MARRSAAERTAASSSWVAPPAFEFSHRTDRLSSNVGARETEAGIVWSLWLPGQRTRRLAAADAEQEVAELSGDVGRLRLAGQLRDAAAEIELQAAEQSLAATSAQSLQTLAADVARRVSAGDLARADDLAARAEWLSAQAAQSQAEQRLKAARLQWAHLTGLADTPKLESEPGASTTQEHPALRLAQRQTELARKRLDVVTVSSRGAPEVITRLRQDTAGRGESSVNSIGIALRLPLGSAARNEPLVAAALTELEVAQAVELQLRDQLQTDIEMARSAVDAAKAQRDSEQTRQQLLEQRAELVARSFQAGETALPEMLRVNAAAAHARLTAARKDVAYRHALARLQQALGVLP